LIIVPAEFRAEFEFRRQFTYLSADYRDRANSVRIQGQTTRANSGANSGTDHEWHAGGEDSSPAHAPCTSSTQATQPASAEHAPRRCRDYPPHPHQANRQPHQPCGTSSGDQQTPRGSLTGSSPSATPPWSGPLRVPQRRKAAGGAPWCACAASPSPRPPPRRRPNPLHPLAHDSVRDHRDDDERQHGVCRRSVLGRWSKPQPWALRPFSNDALRAEPPVSGVLQQRVGGDSASVARRRAASPRDAPRFPALPILPMGRARAMLCNYLRNHDGARTWLS
jgi:hypothetical protein